MYHFDEEKIRESFKKNSINMTEEEFQLLISCFNSPEGSKDITDKKTEQQLSDSQLLLKILSGYFKNKNYENIKCHHYYENNPAILTAIHNSKTVGAFVFTAGTSEYIRCRSNMLCELYDECWIIISEEKLFKTIKKYVSKKVIIACCNKGNQTNLKILSKKEKIL